MTHQHQTFNFSTAMQLFITMVQYAQSRPSEATKEKVSLPCWYWAAMLMLGLARSCSVVGFEGRCPSRQAGSKYNPILDFEDQSLLLKLLFEQQNENDGGVVIMVVPPEAFFGPPSLTISSSNSKHQQQHHQRTSSLTLSVFVNVTRVIKKLRYCKSKVFDSKRKTKTQRGLHKCLNKKVQQAGSSSKKKILKKKLMVDRADHRRHLSFKKENKKWGGKKEYRCDCACFPFCCSGKIRANKKPLKK